MLGVSGTELDLTLGMAPVVAYGECIVGEDQLSLSIHELNADNLIEIQFSGVWPIPDEMTVASGWTYSYWKPGMPCPATNTPVREVRLTDPAGTPLYTLALSPAKRVVWLYHHSNGFNQLIALTGFADEVFRTHKIRDANVVTHPATLLERVDEFSDDDLRHAAIEYNMTSTRRFDATKVAITAKAKEKSLIARLLGRG